MKIKENDVNKFLAFFLLAHLIIWTLVPSISNVNLPLDTIEALGWSDKLQLGYDKYPPIFPLFVELFYYIQCNVRSTQASPKRVKGKKPQRA